MNIIFKLKYNGLSRIFLKKIDATLPLSNRQKSMFIDFVLSIFAISPIIVAAIIWNSLMESEILSQIFIPLAFVLVVLTKDLKDGQSIGKKLTGYKVIDSKTQTIAKPFQCAIRNLTFIIWPIEAILVLGTPNYRIGDFIARTKVIECKRTDPATIK